MNILVAYFSATGNTAKVAKAVGSKLSELGHEVAEWDITTPDERHKGLNLDSYQAFVFGFPSHSCRAPRIAREWLETLEGGSRKCSTFFTFGGFGIDPCHYTTKQILDRRGFKLAASAQFIGVHTFNLGGWRAMAGRPDRTDLEAAEEFALKSSQRFTGQDPALISPLKEPGLSEEQMDEMEGRRYQMVSQLPTREGRECGLCMTCQDMCPAGAMDAEKGEADKDKCIVCLRCVANCPEEALKINDLSSFWSVMLERFKVSEEELNLKKSRLLL